MISNDRIVTRYEVPGSPTVYAEGVVGLMKSSAARSVGKRPISSRSVADTTIQQSESFGEWIKYKCRLVGRRITTIRR